MLAIFCERVEEVVSGFDPDEGLWLCVVVVEVVSDGGFELPCGAEAVAADLLFGQRGEEAFDLVEATG